jgi:pimeloyl-ACP methyl ester carboxylesterase
MIPATTRVRCVRLHAVLLAAALLLGASAGCTSGGAGAHGVSPSPARSTPSSPGQGSAQPPVAQGPPPTTLAGFYAQHLTWVTCDTSFQCARLYVPFDYAHPNGPVFSLPVVKLAAAQPAQRIGDLVINPGGPGGSGLQYALAARTGEFTQAIRDRFDIVGFDPRGVGGSVPALRCMTGRQLDAYFAVNEAPATPAQLAAAESANQAYAQACARNARALLPYLGTSAAARDMDLLRAALAQSRLTFLGKSYGTVLGASYIQQFPHRVRAFVLDGAVAPQASGLDLDIAQAQGFTVAFGQFVTWCASQRNCPLAGTVPQATQQVSGLIARGNGRPLASELPGGQPANGAMMLLGIAAALYSKSTWTLLKDGLSLALTSGDGSVLVELADSLTERNPDGSYSNLSDVGTAVDCIDRPWPRSIATWQAAAAAAAKVAPLFGPTLVYGSLPCAYWSVPARQVLSGTASAPAGAASAAGGTASASGGVPPVLVVGDLHDPATPYAWAVALARWLRQGGRQQGVLLGWNGEGHTSYMQGSSCVDNAVDAYLISLRTPPNGTVCP